MKQNKLEQTLLESLLMSTKKQEESKLVKSKVAMLSSGNYGKSKKKRRYAAKKLRNEYVQKWDKYHNRSAIKQKYSNEFA